MIEADFCQYYSGADLRDFYRRGTGMTYRWVASHIRQLPLDSRWVKHHRDKDGRIWDQQDHHRQDTVDILTQILYYLQTDVLATIKKSDRRKVTTSSPARPLRPGEEKAKPQMTAKEDLKVFFSHARGG